jgi:hypothetical protein
VIKLGATDGTDVAVQHEIDRFCGFFCRRFHWELHAQGPEREKKSARNLSSETTDREGNVIFRPSGTHDEATIRRSSVVKLN